MWNQTVLNHSVIIFDPYLERKTNWTKTTTTTTNCVWTKNKKIITLTVECALLNVILEHENWFWKAKGHLYFYFLIFLPIYFSHCKFWKVDFVGENKNQKHKTFQKKVKPNIPTSSTHILFLFLFLIITVGLFYWSAFSWSNLQHDCHWWQVVFIYEH